MIGIELDYAGLVQRETRPPTLQCQFWNEQGLSMFVDAAFGQADDLPDLIIITLPVACALLTEGRNALAFTGISPDVLLFRLREPVFLVLSAWVPFDQEINLGLIRVL